MAPASDDPMAPDPPTVSCTYFVYDPWSRELTFANAGHDAPLLVADGQASQLDVGDKGVLLGVRGKGIRGLPTYKEESLFLPSGATLVLYTDGLTDRRARIDGGHYTEDEALAMLCQAVGKAAAGSADAIARAAQESVPGDIDDDMAIVVVRSLPAELDSREKVFPAEPVMVSEARRMALETFRDWGMDSAQAELACLLVSEVVTNAVLHTAAAASPRRQLADFDLDPAPSEPVTAAVAAAGPAAGSPGPAPAPPAEKGGGPWTEPLPVWIPGRPPFSPAKDFAMRLRRGSSAVWVEVFDADMRLPRIRTAEESDEGGRGLYLVEQLATRWGSRPTRNGKAVWFEVPIDGGQARPA